MKGVTSLSAFFCGIEETLKNRNPFGKIGVSGIDERLLEGFQ